MRIGIDAHFASSRYGGLGTYTVNIIQALANLGHDQIVAFAPGGRELDQELPSNPCLHICTVYAEDDTPTDFWRFRVHWEQVVLPTQLTQQKVDIFFGPAFIAPLDWIGPRVVTVHDLLFERSEYYNHQQSNNYYTTWAKRCAEQADAIIAVSQCTAEDVKTLWMVEDIPVRLVYSAAALPFVPKDRKVSKDIVSARLGISHSYILYVGDNSPRKNLDRLIQAYSSLNSALLEQTQLVLATAHGEADSLIAQCRVTDRARVIGYCDPVVLPHLYSAAEMLVFPSLFEGFGLPALEAMACGTPVIASNTGALPEIVGDAAVLINPLDTDEIRNAIELLLSDRALHHDLASRGRQRANQFSWTRAAKETRAVLEWAFSHRGRPM